MAAILRGARYQAVRVRAGAGLEQFGLVRSWIASTREHTVGPSFRFLRESLAEAAPPGPALPAAALLIEGWATAASYHLARRLAKDGRLDIETLVSEGRLPGNRRRWLEAALAGLEQSGLLQRSGSSRIVSDVDLPQPEIIFSTLAAQHPERAPELLLAASVGAALKRFGLGHGALTAPSEGAVDAYEMRSPSVVGAASALGARLSRIIPPGSAEFALRVLQVGVGPATSETLRFAAGRGARVTILDLDAPRLERARLNCGDGPSAAFCGDLEALPESGFDLVVSAGGLSRLAARRGDLGRLAKKCAEGALIIAVEPAPSLFRDLTLV